MRKVTHFYFLLIVSVALFTFCPFTAQAQVILQNLGFSGGSGKPTSTNYSMLISSYSQESKKLTSTFLLTSNALSAMLSSVHEPVVGSVSPAKGFPVSQSDTVTITGVNFRSGLSVVLRRTGEADIPGTGVLVPNATTIHALFDLAGKKVGTWNVVVTNTDGTVSTLANGFEIQAKTLFAGIAFNSPNPFDPAAGSTTVYYNLDANTNLEALLFTTTGNLIMRRRFTAGESGGTAGQNSFQWDGHSGLGDLVGNGVYLLHLLNLDTGNTILRGKVAVLYR